MRTDEIFLERYRLKDERPDSFAESQVKLAKESIDRFNALGENLFEVLQGQYFSVWCLLRMPHFEIANIILTWYYWSHGR